MAAIVHGWGSVAPPTSAYLDACFIVDLYQQECHRLGGRRPAYAARASAASSFLTGMLAAGTDVWTSPLGIEEAMHAVGRSVAGPMAAREAHRVYRLARRLGVNIRWPAGSDHPRAGDVALALTCRFLRRHGLRGPKDALHAAFAFMDGPCAIVTCDRHFSVIDDLTVFSYAPP